MLKYLIVLHQYFEFQINSSQWTDKYSKWPYLISERAKMAYRQSQTIIGERENISIHSEWQIVKNQS